MSIAQALKTVHSRLEQAARQAGREPSAIRLIAVSKRKPASAVREAYAAGQRDFGENYVQELLEKAEQCADLPELRWHMIGHLQRNKAKQVVRCATAVHTVDSARLASELGRRAEGGSLSVLVEVNTGGEAQKSGCGPDELSEVLEAIEAQPALSLSGLMTVPPHTKAAAEAQRYFELLRELREAHGGVERLPELSMGMSHDLEYAVQAGATQVRIGTAIFGAR